MERNTKGNIGGKEKFKRGKNKMRRKSIFENLIKLDFQIQVHNILKD